MAEMDGYVRRVVTGHDADGKAVILSGEITMLLDEEDVHLRAGDVLVQVGTNHAWVNRSDAVCEVLFVLIDGQFEPDLAASLEARG